MKTEPINVLQLPEDGDFEALYGQPSPNFDRSTSVDKSTSLDKSTEAPLLDRYR